MRNEQTMQKLKKRLQEHLGKALDRVIVFGSVARGSAKDTSDIDVMIILNDELIEVNWRTEDDIMTIAYPIELEEDAIPVSEEVKGACELLGLDPLYIANEGKLCCFVPEKYADKVLEQMRNHPLGSNAKIIGKVVEQVSQKVYLKTIIGGRRIVDMPSGQQLPRIC